VTALDPRLVSYVMRYYRRFMTKQEHLVAGHLFGTMKVTKGRSDAAAQAEVQAGQRRLNLKELLSSDPEILKIAHDGYDAFTQRTATRILAEHSEEIYLNHCPRCNALANTPKARQCRFCFHDWHEPRPDSKAGDD